MCQKLGKPHMAKEFVVTRHNIWKQFQNQSLNVQNFIANNAEKLMMLGRLAIQVDHWVGLKLA